MSYKRSRATYEKDLQAQESPFVVYGTPLPPLDDETRDDGSYVPVWKQEVRDEQGRKRLHGAFTGGFSAGYFNTVGSKEGWTPSTFVSSRTNRKKDQQRNEQRPEDYMDEEDLAEAAEAQALQTSQAFAGLGSTGEDEKRKGFLTDLFKPEGNTMGMRLLQKMGWRQGQGIGPRVRRRARADAHGNGDNTKETEHLFAPENSRMISFIRKDDNKGLGYAGEGKLAAPPTAADQASDEEHPLGVFNRPSDRNKSALQPKSKPSGFGVGVLNDMGSDDDDPYEMGPRISYNRVIGGDKKKPKARGAKVKPTANPLLKNKPVFLSKKTTPIGFRKCHDGRLPLPGFILADPSDQLVSLGEDERWPQPTIPAGWVSAKKPTITTSATIPDPSTYKSTADAARASKLDPRARAAMLGETQLPGKSVFDFLSPAARERIVSATGKSNLPAALSEQPPETTTSKHPTTRKPTSFAATPTTLEIPPLDKSTALSALGRGLGGWTPYAEDPAKLSRYRLFLEYRAELLPSLPDSHRPPDMKPDSYIQELREFAHAAQVFKPITGMMASRFTSSSSSTPVSRSVDEKASTAELLSNPATSAGTTTKPEDPAETAARMGMFGPLTRSVESFAPTRLVCKRFGVRPPSHVQPDAGEGGNGNVPVSRGGDWGSGGGPSKSGSSSGVMATSASAWTVAPRDLVSDAAMKEMVREANVIVNTTGYGGRFASGGTTTAINVNPIDIDNEQHQQGSVEVEINSERNEALEGQRAGDAVFRAVFGSDSDSED